MTSLAAAVLAGGRSSRMGHDKALISLGAETLIQRTCRVAIASADAVYVVTPWGDRYRPLVPASVQFIAEHKTDSQGPLVALVQALIWLREQPEHTPEWVLLLACDMPNLSATALSTWRTELATIPLPYLAYLPQRQQRWEPLCGFYRAAALESLQQYAIASPTRSLQGWLNQHPVQPIPSVDDALLANLNTPAEFQQWQRAAKP
ncbi:molybdenum cofactor guanylyltransferase [Nodosilinea sp. LEGE 06152]|uniref:molybdenum cofactor guanylyltransferase n=1 Tax=Nodosilinea sp. LEGE 06152 TaxID=2777966 RepID=UPI0018821D0C|nr:molybdenum cofactor guanylyltransferase [Nodosilinea sp. LEGE 06152]MBE9158878.1 molybdenum cofactor guanylyltransferase [Nodosilinea sp. LEGE 06152]